jgi:tRNA pseudouridine32 synthase/23S rRNA pseudouridine746 synthase
MAHFSAIPASVWQQRINAGKVHWLEGEIITLHTPYKAQQCVCYYREVAKEPIIPLKESIVFEDEHLLCAYKPHFLPVMPGGIYVNECLQHRLREHSGIETLQALHRLDKDTAGLVLFAKKPNERDVYHALFSQHRIKKTYQAIAKVHTHENIVNQKWCVNNRIEKSQPAFLMRVVDGDINAQSTIECIKQQQGKALFELKPITGKTHQLRLHMQTIGYPILNDRLYPVLQPQQAIDFAHPLQLLAQQLYFVDPITQTTRHFHADKDLML